MENNHWFRNELIYKYEAGVWVLLMENNHWFRNELLYKYEAGVWVLLIVVAAGIVGLIVWLSYQLLM
jgi:hypothetical protein